MTFFVKCYAGATDHKINLVLEKVRIGKVQLENINENDQEGGDKIVTKRV